LALPWRPHASNNAPPDWGATKQTMPQQSSPGQGQNKVTEQQQECHGIPPTATAFGF